MAVELPENTASMTHRDWRRKLRAEMLARRQSLLPQQHADWSAQIVEHLLRHFTPAAGTTVGFCWPFRNEPDIRGAILSWLTGDARAALPVVLTPGAPMRFREWKPGCTLEPDRHGIPTPIVGDWLTPSVLLMPVNAYDRDGYRLGYGGGYFDRTLAGLNPRPLAVGVGFSFSGVDTIAPEAHDQRMDWLVTEAGVCGPFGRQEA